jgi:hypothetical protein
MNIYTIYRATNIITGKVYIGFDSYWPKRKGEHKGSVQRGEPYKFYNAIRKYGWDNFVWDIIYQSKDYDHCLNTMEQHFIDEYDSIRHGYNSAKGGGKGAYGSFWWNNGVQQVFTEIPPDDTFTKGRLNFNNTGASIGSAITANKYWVNNGQINIMIFKTDPIPEGFNKGRLRCFGGTHGAHSKGSKWWNNGKISTMSHQCPGEDYIPGRLKSQL